MIIEVTIPEKVSLNQVKGMGWRKWYRLAELYHNEVIELRGKLKVEEYPVVIRYEFFWTKNATDSLNNALIAKLLEDGLVKAKVLVDDSPEYVRESQLVSQKSKKYKHDTVVITICSLN